MLTYLAIAERYQPRWLVWENVPGVLSSNRGRDFGTFLGALGQLGYGFAYRVLDAQYFGVAQRRRRVFVVGYLGDWRRAAAVLFERESMSGHPAPSREAKQETTGYTSGSFGSYSESRGVASTVTAAGRDIGGGSETLVAGTITANAFVGGISGKSDGAAANHIIASVYGWGEELTALKDLQPTIQRGGEGGRHEGVMIAFPAEMSGTQAASTPEMSPTLSVKHTTAVAFTASAMANSYAWERDVYPTLNAQVPNDTSNIQYGIRQDMMVRRLTPIECERLQGFPDNYTQIPWRNKDAHECPDGPRYKAMGNSMAVPVMRWIGERIQMVEDMTQ